MSDQEVAIQDLQRGDELYIESPEIGVVTVLLPGPKQRTRTEDGRHHVVFVHPSGRIIGINLPPETALENCVLVADETGFQHAIVGTDREPVLFTRRQPGQPDDWERREELELRAAD